MQVGRCAVARCQARLNSVLVGKSGHATVMDCIATRKAVATSGCSAQVCCTLCLCKAGG